tara:strand:- start:607 stop:852 length:246 start_codon:yes stop_codon:yes gene_type:complete
VLPAAELGCGQYVSSFGQPQGVVEVWTGQAGPLLVEVAGLDPADLHLLSVDQYALAQVKDDPFLVYPAAASSDPARVINTL